MSSFYKLTIIKFNIFAIHLNGEPRHRRHRDGQIPDSREVRMFRWAHSGRYVEFVDIDPANSSYSYRWVTVAQCPSTNSVRFLNWMTPTRLTCSVCFLPLYRIQNFSSLFPTRCIRSLQVFYFFAHVTESRISELNYLWRMR